MNHMKRLPSTIFFESLSKLLFSHALIKAFTVTMRFSSVWSSSCASNCNALRQQTQATCWPKTVMQALVETMSNSTPFAFRPNDAMNHDSLTPSFGLQKNCVYIYIHVFHQTCSLLTPLLPTGSEEWNHHNHLHSKDLKFNPNCFLHSD